MSTTGLAVQAKAIELGAARKTERERLESTANLGNRMPKYY